jgi:hypothetical protein
MVQYIEDYNNGGNKLIQKIKVDKREFYYYGYIELLLTFISLLLQYIKPFQISS